MNIKNYFTRKIDIEKKILEYGTIHLPSLSVIKISGDSKKAFEFLQGQVTSDIEKLQDNAVQLSAICNQKGFVMSDFYIVKQKDTFKIVISKDQKNIFIEELKPFIKFYNCEFVESSEYVFGHITFKKDKTKTGMMKTLENKEIKLYISLHASKIDESKISNYNWNIANAILNNYSMLAEDLGKFRPLELNYDKLRVSFDKGCFRGQEIIARMKYLGVSRRKFITVIADDKYINEKEIGLIGKPIFINNKKVFHAMIKTSFEEELTKNNLILKVTN
jgi:folate-binding protein YgfZ